MNGIHAFTGHRPPKLGGYGKPAKRALVNFAIEVVKSAGTKKAIVGMALGWDQAVAEACLRLNVPFVAAVPFPGQEAYWPKESQDHYRWLLSQANETHVVSPLVAGNSNRASAFMMVRNKWMVERCSEVHALWDGSRGGTGNCVLDANISHVRVINHWDAWERFQQRVFEDAVK